METVPEEVSAWAVERAEARRVRDFGRADELRTRIAAAGWEVVDEPTGFALRRAGAIRPAPSVSVLLDVRTWPQDASRFLGSVGRHSPSCEVEVVEVDADLGFGAGHNAALEAATAGIVVIADTSLELTGDLLAALVDALTDPAVAVAGPFGLVSGDLRDYEERTVGDVVAVQGYCLAARRADLEPAGGVRESFAFYRNADIDLSLRLRTLRPGAPRRAVAVGADLCVRHAHRAWEATPEEERDRASRRNMGRVLKRFGDRLDLAVT